MQDMKAYGGM